MITVPLHPTANTGEAATAVASFEKRILELTISAVAYGNHRNSLTITFDQPEDMTRLGKELIKTANLAKKYLSKHP